MQEKDRGGRNADFKAGHWMKTVGKWMVVGCILCMFAGRFVVSVFFPEMKGQGRIVRDSYFK